MDFRKILSVIFFFLMIILIVNLAPSIDTANDTIRTSWGAATNNASMIGMSAVLPFGAPLIILQLIVAAGLLSFSIYQKASIKDSLAMVGIVIIMVVGLNFFNGIISPIDTLLTGATGIESVIYGIIPIAVYLPLVASAGGYKLGKMAYDKYKARKGAKKTATAGVGSGY